MAESLVPVIFKAVGGQVLNLAGGWVADGVRKRAVRGATVPGEPPVPRPPHRRDRGGHVLPPLVEDGEADDACPACEVHSQASIARGKVELAAETKDSRARAELAALALQHIDLARQPLPAVTSTTPSLTAKVAGTDLRLAEARLALGADTVDWAQTAKLVADAERTAGGLARDYTRLHGKQMVEQRRLQVLAQAHEQGLGPRETLAMLREVG